MWKNSSKYHAQRTAGYDSKKEHERAQKLKLLQRAGKIAHLQEQVSFELIPTQRDPLTGKVTEHSCKYIADFVYVDTTTGKTVVEDVKGVRTDVYVIKRKLMLHVYGIRIKEV